LENYEPFISLIFQFFFSGRGEPRVTETAVTESVDTGAHLYAGVRFLAHGNNLHNKDLPGDPAQGYDDLIVRIIGNIYTSAFQPGFRGTLGYREHFLGVPRNVEIINKLINNITSLINA
jgi:hypothetical protein